MTVAAAGGPGARLGAEDERMQAGSSSARTSRAPKRAHHRSTRRSIRDDLRSDHRNRRYVRHRLDLAPQPNFGSDTVMDLDPPPENRSAPLLDFDARTEDRSAPLLDPDAPKISRRRGDAGFPSAGEVPRLHASADLAPAPPLGGAPQAAVAV